MTGKLSLAITMIAGLFFLIQGIQLATDLSDKSARKLMFASFAYIPVVFIALVLDRI
jgi:protoheme IX farnesyltransferase